MWPFSSLCCDHSKADSNVSVNQFPAKLNCVAHNRRAIRRPPRRILSTSYLVANVPIRQHYTSKLCIRLDKIHRVKFQRLWNRVSSFLFDPLKSCLSVPPTLFPIPQSIYQSPLSPIHPIISQLSLYLSFQRINSMNHALCKLPNLRIMCLVSLSTVVLALMAKWRPDVLPNMPCII